ncbi:MAG: hypothetical protein K0U72_03895 [Gammaproteobacteria bacterium]|nr:hypothetical protein [Gammaproteobacteria bacterium]
MSASEPEWKGILASILLAKTAVATFSIAPFLVGGYIDHLGFSAAEAGRLLSVEIFALAISNALAFFWIHRVSCRKWAQRLLVLVVACNLLCIYAPAYDSLLLLRIVVGALEGALLALGFGLLGKTRRPNRNFGLYFAVSLTIGAINVRILPLFLEAAGVTGLFVNLCLYAVIALAGSVWVQKHRVAGAGTQDAAVKSSPGGFAIAAVPLAFLIVANYVYFVGQGGVWSFLERLGLQQGIDLAGIASALSLSLIAGVAGGATAGWLDLRLGRVWPLLAAMIFALTSIGLLFNVPGALSYTVAACLFNYGNNLGHPYVLGFAAELDDSSRLTVLSGALHTAGQATGPLIAGLIVTAESYTNVLWLGTAAFVATMLLFLPVVAAMRK